MPHFRLTRVTWKRFWFNALLYHINPLKFWVSQMKCKISPVARVVRVVPLDKAPPPPHPSRQLCSQGGSIEMQVHQRLCKWDAVLLCDTSYNKYPPFTTKMKWMTKAFEKKRRNCNLINKCIALILETAIFVIFL